MTTTLMLTPDQEAWLQAHIARGDFASVEAAARQRIAERAAEESRMSGRREALLSGELSDADLAAIAATEMDARRQHLDSALAEFEAFRQTMPRIPLEEMLSARHEGRKY